MGYDYSDSNSMGISHARAIEKHPDFFCIGAFDLDKEKSIQFEKQFSVKTFDSLEVGLLECKPEVVIIATPTKEHLLTLIEVLKNCIPLVILCEKPLAIDAKTGESFLKSARAAKVPVFVNYFRNSAQSTLDIKEHISTGVFKQPFYGKCQYNKGALNTASHFLNMFELWFGSDFIFKMTDQFPNPNDKSDPNVSGELVFPGGVISIQPDLFEQELIFEAQVNFENGVLFYSNEGEIIRWIPRAGSYLSLNDHRNSTIEFATSLKDYQYHVMTELSKFLHDKPHNLCDVASALDYVVKLTQREARGFHG